MILEIVRNSNGWLWLATGVLVLANLLCFSRKWKEFALELLIPATLLTLLGNLIEFVDVFSQLSCPLRASLESNVRGYIALTSYRMIALALPAIPVLIVSRKRFAVPSERNALSTTPLLIGVMDGGIVIAAGLPMFFRVIP